MMEEHECKYEYRWGKTTEAIAGIERAAKSIGDCTDSIKQAVNDLSTQVALNRQAVRRTWWWVGGISIALLGIAVYVIRAGMP
jgi:hypothetical protein